MKGRLVLLGFALGVLTSAGVIVTGVSPEPQARAATRLDRQAFHHALDTILDRYVDPVDRAALLSRGLKHMVAGLDPHSHYMTAVERRALARRSRGGHSGLWVSMRTGDGPRERWLEVVGVAPGSAAEKAGLAAGDHILSVRDREVAFLLSQADAEALLVGRKGETIALTVQKRDEVGPRAVALTLQGGGGPLVEGKTVHGDGGPVAHVRIAAFRHGTGKRVKKTLRELERAAGAGGLSGVVIDVRGNPGGEVDEALIVADMFLDSGVLTRTRGRGGQILREELAHQEGSDTATPLVILQDRHSASASELLAAALQDHGRARVVGEVSYGKGTVQEVMGMEDGSVLTLTIARYFSPRDRLIDGVGVTPDVDLAPASSKSGDKALDAALRALSSSAG